MSKSQLDIIFRKRATNYRALLRKITHKNKASYGCLPPCSSQPTFDYHMSVVPIVTCASHCLLKILKSQPEIHFIHSQSSSQPTFEHFLKSVVPMVMCASHRWRKNSQKSARFYIDYIGMYIYVYIYVRIHIHQIDYTCTYVRARHPRTHAPCIAVYIQSICVLYTYTYTPN